MVDSCQNAIQNYIKAYARHTKNAKILDIGCGDGKYTSLFCHNNNEVVGLDIKNRVKPEQKKFKFIKGNAENLPFADNFFDLIISFDVLEHISDDSKAIKEMFRVLRKNGRLFLETLNRERLSYWTLMLMGRKRKYPLVLAEDCVHLREYTKCELEKKFKKNGFGKIEISPFWLGLRSSLFDKGVIKPPKFLEKFSQLWIVKAEK